LIGDLARQVAHRNGNGSLVEGPRLN